MSGSNQDNDVWVHETDVVAPLPYTGIIPIYSIYPSEEAKAGSVDATIPKSANWLDRYTGFEVGINARLPNGGTVFGAWTAEVPGESSGSGINNHCGGTIFEGDNPNSLRFCNEFNNPGNWLHEFKLSGAYPLPWYQIQLAGTLQAYPGNSMWEYWYYSRRFYYPSIYARYDPQFYNDTNCVDPCTVGALFNTTGGRGKTGQYSTSSNGTSRELLPYASVKNLPYFTQLDLSMARIFNVDNWRIDTRFEAFNIFNAGTVLGINNGTGTTYGGQGVGAWEASRVMTGRVLRLSMTARF